MAKSHWIGNDSLVCHAFNGDASLMAASINTNNVYILKVPSSSTGKFELIDILQEHTALVTGIDWSPSTNLIVSCSADRNAYVWKQNNEGKWKPTLVALQLNRAALCVKWSPQGNKFAVGSGNKVVAVCSFEKEQDWWVSKHIKKHIKSSVTCIDWHPNNAVIACGSTDYRVRVFSAAIKNVDTQNGDSVWGAESAFQTLLFEAFNGHGAWVHSVCFSADGNKLAWTGHDCSLSIADASGGPSNPPVVIRLRHSFLPFISCIWVAPSTIIAAGHDCCPVAFHYANGQIEDGKQIDVKSGSQSSNKLSAMLKFQNIDRMAATESATRLDTIHQNPINELRVYKGNRQKATQVTSVGRDGQLVMWDMESLASKIAGLTIN